MRTHCLKNPEENTVSFCERVQLRSLDNDENDTKNGKLQCNVL